jgi:hypothetical protein
MTAGQSFTQHSKKNKAELVPADFKLSVGIYMGVERGLNIWNATSMPSFSLEHTHAVLATGICMLVTKAPNGANINGGSLTMLLNISIRHRAHPHTGHIPGLHVTGM